MICGRVDPHGQITQCQTGECLEAGGSEKSKSAFQAGRPGGAGGFDQSREAARNTRDAAEG
jgi:hypothetical protein